MSVKARSCGYPFAKIPSELASLLWFVLFPRWQVRKAELEREMRKWKRTLALIRRKDGDVVDTSQVFVRQGLFAVYPGLITLAISPNWAD